MAFTPYTKEDQLNRSGGIHADDMKRYKDRSMKWMKAKAKDLCHAYVRDRDRDGNHFTCISCGITKMIQSKPGGGSNYHAGHFIAAGECEMLRLDEVNINGQCDQCNYFKHGNLLHYESNFIRKWGRRELNRLRAVASYNKRVPKKWTKIELVEIIQYYQTKHKNLKHADTKEELSNPIVPKDNSAKKSSRKDKGSRTQAKKEDTPVPSGRRTRNRDRYLDLFED